MCGILGWLGRNRLDEKTFCAAVDLLQHRGPDDAGMECFQHADVQVWLGHRRLSILDLSAAGHQPMFDESRRYCIVFNGEIYNYQEVRRSLEARGCRFRSTCDTEVLLYSYQHWGPSCLDRLNGMFAFGVWDALEQTLFLARDRLGEKPLYYATLTTGGIAFASEIKALLQLPGVRREMATEQLNRFLAFLWVPDPDTLFRGIYKLPPGYWLRWKEDRIETRQWWDVPLEPQ